MRESFGETTPSGSVLRMENISNYQMMGNISNDAAMGRVRCFEWHVRFKSERTSLEIQLDSQKVLYTVREVNFQDTFQKWQERWRRCIAVQEDYFEGIHIAKVVS
ncbi:hypothetical protein AVEN_175723-1 [Araneus ventricosus]|uniref:Uncharacterized protein n=1 Tax=Araneus ventricosus TaxID=182803 RepID=A0A4Y2G2V1_ARAVE|nr:hypothetical protein AVEN_8298-1 [Araneus ventricosus]GBM46969.1 hypothetical protein AVEN_267511-1 [Araneus ventricosus]GBM46979.1 hypothetical protein AVEN_17764-1 [Araneus ventricosus]GBM47054.1 hypothetical protein AVEN_175723-1 [Araneus ventricosus]